MSPAEARTLAQSDPVPTLTARWGTASAAARRSVERLVSDFRELDKVRSLLKEHGLTVSEDLGPVGNAALAAWRTTEEHARTHTSTFSLPRAVA